MLFTISVLLGLTGIAYTSFYTPLAKVWFFPQSYRANVYYTVKKDRSIAIHYPEELCANFPLPCMAVKPEPYVKSSSNELSVGFYFSEFDSVDLFHRFP
ncbi:hypothetical protein [Xanthovirga aplysinae]|uniref:hypothetical protein n=1 Tax=Xanthovirga aplysinae TaxID=2529853 RepID=UPI0012BCCD3D|nr:hypothetical protein [Xanthovirga aplysinae]MTI32851.1 hypothetical protein [Xanthovirga aplysinae]